MISPAINREGLAAMPFEPRREAIVEWMRVKVAAALRLAPDRISLDWRPDNPLVFLAMLHRPLYREFGLLLYRRDASSFDSILMAAAHVAREVEMPPVPVSPLRELYGKGAWGWGSLERNFGKRLGLPVVFILSATRCGSTLLRIMLAGHPGLFAPPELALLPFASLRQQSIQADVLDYHWIRSGLPSALRDVERLSIANTVAEIEALERNDVPMPAIFDRLQRAASPRVLVDKSPFNGFHPEWLGYAEKVFSQARYIHLVRHPLPSIESFVRMRFHRMFGRHWLIWDENPWHYGEKFWTSANRQIMSFLAGIEPERQLRVAFEKLVTDPTAATGEICRFLGVPHDRAVLAPYSGNRMVRDFSASGPAAGDPNFLLRSGIDPALASPTKRGYPVLAFRRADARRRGGLAICGLGRLHGRFASRHSPRDFE
jgi:hypothetical protein